MAPDLSRDPTEAKAKGPKACVGLGMAELIRAVRPSAGFVKDDATFWGTLELSWSLYHNIYMYHVSSRQLSPFL